MPGLLRAVTDDDPLDAPRTLRLVVGGELYTHAAAKFWPSLIDEMITSFPGSTMVRLTAPSTGPLVPDLLFPERALQRQIDALDGVDLDDTLSEALAEINLLGPPGPVLAQVFKGREEKLTRPLPLDSLDAETFAAILVWQYYWAGLPSARWNDASLGGIVTGDDPDRNRLYRMTFSSTTLPVAEGLISRAFSLVPSVRCRKLPNRG